MKNIYIFLLNIFCIKKTEQYNQRLSIGKFILGGYFYRERWLIDFICVDSSTEEDPEEGPSGMIASYDCRISCQSSYALYIGFM